MCHTLLQHYIHCRHTNIHFYHCHVDIGPRLPWSPSSYPSPDLFERKLKYKCTHPNYDPLPNITPGDEDPATWRSHNLPVGIAHSYLRKCPGCVRKEIREIAEDEDFSERLRAEGVQRWRNFATSSCEGSATQGGENSGVLEVNLEDDEDKAELDGNSVAESEDGGLMNGIDRWLLENTRREFREAERSRRLAADEERAEPRVTTSAGRTSNTDRAEVQRASVRESRTRSPSRPRIVVDDLTRLGHSVDQQQVHMDVMARARLAEQHIWEQDGRGRLTLQQRALVFQAQPLLATIPEELRGSVARELAEYQTMNLGRGNSETVLGARRALWIDGAADEADVRNLPAPTRIHHRMDALGTGSGNSNFSVEGRQHGIRSVSIRLVGTERSGDVSRGTVAGPLLRLVLPEIETNTAATDVNSVFREDFSSEEKPSPRDAPQYRTMQPRPLVRNTDLYDFPAWRKVGDNREVWELLRRSDGNDNTEFSVTKSSLSTISNMASPTFGCPCHSSKHWTTVCNAATHLGIREHVETLAEQRDSPAHRSFRLPRATNVEALSHDTWEIGVEFQGCGHQVAVFVERLRYTNAANIRATCGCYGFDRCLVAHRKAISRQKCLICRIEKQRRAWSRKTGQSDTERCPWFESWARLVRTKRDWVLWPYGSRRAQSELGVSSTD